MDNYYQLLLNAELDLAQQNPLTEAEYQFNEDAHNPLKLFDCYLPVLKKYMISKPNFVAAHTEHIKSVRRTEDSYYM